MPRNNVIPGPKVASWTCPSCRSAVPRLLPNGQHNRVRVTDSRLFLDAPEIRAALPRVPGLRAGEICYACSEIYQELLGTLLRPPGEEGDARSAPGLNDTGIIGALLPLAGRGTQILIFQVVDGQLCQTEIEEMRRFNPDRLTYPGSRGAIAPEIWALYERHRETLQPFV